MRLLLEIKRNLEVIIYANNTNNYLKSSDIDDFRKERPDIKIKLIKIDNIIHDRFIILDDDKVYSLGASSKDIGNKITILHEILDKPVKEALFKILK